MLIQVSFYFIYDMYSFAISRFLAGYSFSFMLSIPSTIAAEITTLEQRGRIQLLINIFLTLGRVLVAGSTFYFLDDGLQSGDWKLMMVSPILLNIITAIGLYFFLEESPRYLIANG